MSTYPYNTVLASTTAYTVLCRAVSRGNRSDDLRVTIKGISGLHAILTTCGAVYLLKFGQWPVDVSGGRSISPLARDGKSSHRLDDTKNPIIAGHNVLANMLTAWEAGYLIYDTGALLAEVHLKYPTKTASSTVSTLARRSPVFLAHHAALISALMYLQHYTANGREKGVWVIVAMLLMNASNPLLHLRWYRKKQTGKSDRVIDLALVLVFALTRFGSVYWILRSYAAFHRTGTLDAIRRQRVVCQTGTGVLVGVNALWWAGLVQGIMKKSHNKTGRS